MFGPRLLPCLANDTTCIHNQLAFEDGADSMFEVSTGVGAGLLKGDLTVGGLAAGPRAAIVRSNTEALSYTSLLIAQNLDWWHLQASVRAVS